MVRNVVSDDLPYRLDEIIAKYTYCSENEDHADYNSQNEFNQCALASDKWS